MNNREPESPALQIVFAAIDEVNLMLPPEQKLAKEAETVLSGANATLDSLGLISLVVAVESAARRQGQEISLADRVGSPQAPLGTVDELAQFIQQSLAANES